MAVEPPFIYEPPTQNRSSVYGNGFNCKAASIPNLEQSKPRSPQPGPLLDFNRHPDSYLILPYGNTSALPMSRDTKIRVKYTRWVQLFLRVCELLGAIGLLVCAICVRGMDGTVGWILRIPPGVAILHTLYAVYHLSHTSTSKTPTSSASYNLFSAVIDVSLLPFYIFVALLSQSQHLQFIQLPFRTTGWHTVFSDPLADSKITMSIFVFGATNGGLHLVSLVLALYLAIIFRKIAKLPPDMNPLEDHLTSRHKKRDSYAAVSEKNKRLTQNSTSPSSSDRNPVVHPEDPLLAPQRTIPFMQTRSDSSSPRTSVHDLPYSPPKSKRNSRADLPSQLQAFRHSPSLSRSSPPPKKRTSYYDLSPTPPLTYNLPTTRPASNWFTYEQSSPMSHRAATPSVISTVSSLRSTDPRGAAYERVPQTAVDEVASVPLATEKRLHPLGANPPTPPPAARHFRIAQEQVRPRRTQAPQEPQQGGLGLGLTRQLSGLGRQFSLRKARLYGEMKSRTPPMMVGGDSVVGNRGRVVSRTGMDEDARKMGVRGRQVSGKVVEEGRGGAR